MRASRPHSPIVPLALVAAVWLACSPGPARAQCQAFGTPVQLTHEVKFGVGIPDEIGVVTVPLAVAGFLLDQCEDLTFEVGTFGVSGSHAVGNSTYGVNWDFSIAGAMSSLVDMLGDPDFGAEDLQPSITANCTFFPEVFSFSGGPSAYTFQIGDPGGPNTRTAGGKVQYCDVVVIQSPVATFVELPYDVTVDMQAAEAFGDPDVTRGYAEAMVRAVIDGVEVAYELGNVESVSTIPEQNTVGAAGVLSIPVQPGLNSVDVSLIIELKIEVVARAAGFAGLLSGAAEASVSTPRSVLGNFQGPGGAPLPEEMHIVSANTGLVYKVGSPTSAPLPMLSTLDVRAFPNPSPGRTSLALRVPEGALAQVRIVDLRGRLVRELGRVHTSTTLDWDGRDHRGSRVNAGVYQVLVETGTDRASRSLIRLR